jgi:ABC-type transport system involved in multi-copper enzyme maturation permease subunit
MKILAIAAITFRELLRRKVQVNLLLFGGALVIASYVVSTLTLGEMHRILADLGLSAMRLISTLLAVFLGASLVATDIERRVIAPVISKPVARPEYLLGRYAGLCGALVANLAAMAALLVAVLVFDARSWSVVDAALLAAFAMIGVQVLVVAAVPLLFSCVTNATLAAIFALAVAIAGSLTNEMRLLWKGGGTWLARSIWHLLPNLGALNANEAVIYRAAPPGTTWWAAGYALLYAATVVVLAMLAFERRDLR